MSARIQVRLEGGRYDGAESAIGLLGDDPVPPVVYVYACAVDKSAPCPLMQDARASLAPGPRSRKLLGRIQHECHDGTGGHWFWDRIDIVTRDQPTAYRWDRERDAVQVYVLDQGERTAPGAASAHEHRTTSLPAGGPVPA